MFTRNLKIRTLKALNAMYQNPLICVLVIIGVIAAGSGFAADAMPDGSPLVWVSILGSIAFFFVAYRVLKNEAY